MTILEIKFQKNYGKLISEMRNQKRLKLLIMATMKMGNWQRLIFVIKQGKLYQKLLMIEMEM